MTTTTAPTSSTTRSTTRSTTTTTTAVAQNKTILVLNSLNGWQPALLVDSNGRQDQLGCFSHDETAEAKFACSVSWQNEFYIFGGLSNRRQISKLVRYNLKVIGSLPFDHYLATCTNMANRKLFLCFNSASSDYKKCRWTNEPLGIFYQATLSSYDHDRARISSSQGKQFYS